MNKEFIPYEQALELKELGFDEACICYYDIEDTNKLKPTPMKEEINSFRFNSVSTMVSAPLYQQAFRWFREKHNLKSWVEEHTKDTFIYEIRPHKSSDYEVGDIYVYKTYKETELACLKKLIEIVKGGIK